MPDPEPPSLPGKITQVFLRHGKRIAVATAPLLEKEDTLKRLDAFIAYQLGQADEALRHFPAEVTDPHATEIVVAASYHIDLVAKAKTLKAAFKVGAEQHPKEG